MTAARVPAISAAVAALVLQAVGAGWALRGSALASIGLFAAGAALAGWPLLRLGGPVRAGNALLVFALALFIPVLGPVGLGAVLVVRARFRPAPRERARLSEAPPLPGQPLVAGGRRFGPGALEGILRHAADPDARMRVVLACRQLRTRSAVALLRLALRDPADDVRLLAYAVLDARERALQVEIQALSRDADRARSPAADARLAELYWELAYQELVEGELHTFCLERALEHARQALRAAAVPRMALVAGRALLRLRRPAEARAFLVDACQRGLPLEVVGPYLAEAGFQLRRPDDVRRHLRSVAGSSRFRPTLANLVESWR